MTKRAATPIVGRDVADQSRLRPPKRVRSVGEFVEFLRRVRAVHGDVPRRVRPTGGDKFLL
jgi:hypothetical protein